MWSSTLKFCVWRCLTSLLVQDISSRPAEELLVLSGRIVEPTASGCGAICTQIYFSRAFSHPYRHHGSPRPVGAGKPRQLSGHHCLAAAALTLASLICSAAGGSVVTESGVSPDTPLDISTEAFQWASATCIKLTTDGVPADIWEGDEDSILVAAVSEFNNLAVAIPSILLLSSTDTIGNTSVCTTSRIF